MNRVSDGRREGPRSGWLVVVMAVAAAGCRDRHAPGAFTLAELQFMQERRAAYWAEIEDLAETEVVVELPVGKPVETRAVVAKNVGERDIDALWVYTNGHFNLYSAQTMMAGAPQGDVEAAVQRIMDLRNRYFQHYPPVSPHGLPHDPVALFGALGYGICDDIAYAAGRLGRLVGLDMRGCDVHMGGLAGRPFAKPFDHYINLIKAGDRFIPLDFDYGVVWRSKSGKLASIDELAKRPELVMAAPYEWVHEGYNVSAIMAQVFAQHGDRLKARFDTPAPGPPAWRLRMQIRLPVGSSFTWRNKADAAGERHASPPAPPGVASGRLEWEIDSACVQRSQYVMAAGSKRVAAVMSPYVLVGRSAKGEAAVGLEAYDGFLTVPQPVGDVPSWSAVGERGGVGLMGRPTLGVMVRGRARGGALHLALRAQTSLASTPTLQPGRNVVRIVGRRGDVAGPFKVAVQPGRVARGAHDLTVRIESPRLAIVFECGYAGLRRPGKD